MFEPINLCVKHNSQYMVSLFGLGECFDFGQIIKMGKHGQAVGDADK